MPVQLVLTLIAAVTPLRVVLRHDEPNRPPQTEAPSSFRSFDQTIGIALLGNRTDGIARTSFGNFDIARRCLSAMTAVFYRASRIALTGKEPDCYVRGAPPRRRGRR